MKNILHIFCAASAATLALTACTETETYAEQKEREEQAVTSYISKHNITPISEETFAAQGDSTSVEKNEYVFFRSSGIYMQIVDKGNGEPVKQGESADLLCRYDEYNINGDSLQMTNKGTFSTSMLPEKMTVRNTSGTFNGTFIEGTMMSVYGSASVPNGWLVPLTYIKPGRNNPENKIARVKIIVPHDKGQAQATSNVYACHYDITYMRAE